MGADSPAKNTPNASKHFSSKCLPKPKSLRFLKKTILWESVVCAFSHFFLDLICKVISQVFCEMIFEPICEMMCKLIFAVIFEVIYEVLSEVLSEMLS